MLNCCPSLCICALPQSVVWGKSITLLRWVALLVLLERASRFSSVEWELFSPPYVPRSQIKPENLNRKGDDLTHSCTTLHQQRQTLFTLAVCAMKGSLEMQKCVKQRGTAITLRVKCQRTGIKLNSVLLTYPVKEILRNTTAHLYNAHVFRKISPTN